MQLTDPSTDPRCTQFPRCTASVFRCETMALLPCCLPRCAQLVSVLSPRFSVTRPALVQPREQWQRLSGAAVLQSHCSAAIELTLEADSIHRTHSPLAHSLWSWLSQTRCILRSITADSARHARGEARCIGHAGATTHTLSKRCIPALTAERWRRWRRRQQWQQQQSG